MSNIETEEARGMESNLFRSKSLERITSPDDLDDYVRVANPGVWILLIAIVILLVGFIIWGVFANLETTVPTIVDTEMNITSCYISEKYIENNSVRSGMTVRCSDEEYTITTIDDQALLATEVLSDYEIHLGGFADGEWIHSASLDRNAQPGAHEAAIVIDSVSPISFILKN